MSFKTIATAATAAFVVMSALVPAGAAAVPAPTGKDTFDARMPDLRDLSTRWDTGIECSAVPFQGDAGTAALTMRVTSDSRYRVAAVQYSYSLAYLGSSLPLGPGKVTVIEDARITNGVPTTTKRNGPVRQATDACSYQSVGLSGQVKVAHLQPIVRPTLEVVLAWCRGQQWYADLPQYCPEWLAMGTSTTAAPQAQGTTGATAGVIG